jgi:hypothetical protein
MGPVFKSIDKSKDRGEGIERRVEVEKSSRPSLSVTGKLD